MDPLEVLPPELVLHLWSFLPIRDRARLWEVSRAWRKLAEDRSLWRHLELDMTDLWDMDTDATTMRVLRRAPCLRSIFFISDIHTKVYQALLESDIKVTRIDNFSDATNTLLPFLVHMAPSLEELSIWHPSEKELDVVQTMLQLRRLQIGNGGDGDPFIFRSPSHPSKLKWFADIGLYCLRPATLSSLLWANAMSLETLVLENEEQVLGLSHELWASLTALQLIFFYECCCVHDCCCTQHCSPPPSPSCHDWAHHVPAGVNIVCRTCYKLSWPLMNF